MCVYVCMYVCACVVSTQYVVAALWLCSSRLLALQTPQRSVLLNQRPLSTPQPNRTGTRTGTGTRPAPRTREGVHGRQAAVALHEQQLHGAALSGQPGVKAAHKARQVAPACVC